ncbi:MAG TPA: molecular chaperone DnaK [Saprospirales bacterium]|nr:molecular chaperone DnaK [Saprospirales bacterium]HRQ29883.1 TraR/DksA C4-type zinc finger protein [Saprospiraceae bacterium]
MEAEEKTRYSDQELMEFKELILEKIEKANDQLAFYKAQLSEFSQSPDGHIKNLEDGISTVENERLMQMASRTQKHIQHLQNALLRIDNKTFGICRVTGKLISKERLKAVPHATMSVEAKNMRNPAF